MSPTTTEPAPTIRNGVPVDKLFATIGKLRENSALAAFTFTAKNSWVEGTASRSTIHEWSGAGGDHVHVQEFAFTSDHPTLGNGHGPTPQEYVLHALASCVVAGIATGAAARKITLDRVDAVATGTIDVRGVLGIDESIRKGFDSIELVIDVAADADADQIDALIEGGRQYSAVFDMLTNATPVNVTRAQ